VLVPFTSITPRFAVVTDYNQFGVAQTVIMSIIVLVVSDGLAEIFIKAKTRQRIKES
jgi:hypothetical protein